MKKIICIMLSVTFPSIFIQLFFYWRPESFIIDEGLILYVITIIGMILFYKFRLCNMWILPLGFVLPIPLCYINDTLNNSEWLSYLNTSLITVYYSIPLIAISIIIAFFLTPRKSKLKSNSITNDYGKKQFFSKKLVLQKVKRSITRKRTQIVSTGVFVIAFFIVVAICWASIGRKNIVRKNIIERIEILSEQEKEYVFKLSEITKFKWDKVAYFKYPITEIEIEEGLGINYKGRTDLLEGFIFVYQGKVVREDMVSIAPENHNRAQLAFNGGFLTILSENEAVFEGIKINDELYEIKLMP